MKRHMTMVGSAGMLGIVEDPVLIVRLFVVLRATNDCCSSPRTVCQHPTVTNVILFLKRQLYFELADFPWTLLPCSYVFSSP